MLYDRKIKYLDYVENGERIGGGGFAKLEMRNGKFLLGLQVNGLHGTDSFLRDVIILTDTGESVLGQMELKEGSGNFRYEGSLEKGIGQTGAGYEELLGIKIPISSTREVRCVWGKGADQAKRIQTKQSGNQEKGIGVQPGANKILGQEAGLGPDPQTMRGLRTGTDRQETASERSTSSTQKGTDERVTLGMQKGRDERAASGTQKGRDERTASGAQKRRDERTALGAQKGRDERAASGAQKGRDEWAASGTQKGADEQVTSSVQKTSGEWKASKVQKISDAGTAQNTWEELDTQTSSDIQKASGAKPATDSQPGLGWQTVSEEQGMGKRDDVPDMQMAMNQRRAQDVRSIPDPQSTSDRQIASGTRSGQEKKSAPRPVRLMEDKWQQLSAIYPHVQPFKDERDYLSIRPSDFVLLPSKSYQAANNSFLLHGYYNYHHLILARVEKRGEVIYYLGVPGNYYPREKQVAVMFGFESFESGQEPAQAGDFGYYMMRTEL